MPTTKHRRSRLARHVPRPLSADEAEAQQSRAGRVAFYSLLGIVLLLVVVGTNWGAIKAFVGDSIRQGAEDAVQKDLEDRRDEEPSEDVIRFPGGTYYKEAGK